MPSRLVINTATRLHSFGYAEDGGPESVRRVVALFREGQPSDRTLTVPVPAGQPVVLRYGDITDMWIEEEN